MEEDPFEKKEKSKPILNLISAIKFLK